MTLTATVTMDADRVIDRERYQPSPTGDRYRDQHADAHRIAQTPTATVTLTPTPVVYRDCDRNRYADTCRITDADGLIDAHVYADGDAYCGPPR